MLLAVDIGNTNITLGLYDDSVLKFTLRTATDNRKTADQYAAELCTLLRMKNSDPADIEDCIISSVVPSVGAAICKAISNVCCIVPLLLGPGVKTGLNIKIDNPAQLGADLVAGAVGALSEYTMPCVIIDMGTATTLSVLDKDGAFLGGVIAAGVGLTLNALSSNTAQLPSISIEAPQSVIGTNTVDCMKAGLVLGTAAMLDGLIDRIEEQLKSEVTVVATGGMSKEVISNCNRHIIYSENLLLDGLKAIYEKNI